MNAADPGNWTGGVINQGQLRGTKFGISAAAYPNLDIASLTEAAAQTIYQRDYWMKLRGDDLPFEVALVTFDAAVNAGLRRAAIWLQQAVGVVPDGLLGDTTLAMVGQASAVAVAREALVRRVDFSSRLPSWQTFGLGWSRRFIALAAQLAS